MASSINKFIFILKLFINFSNYYLVMEFILVGYTIRSLYQILDLFLELVGKLVEHFQFYNESTRRLVTRFLGRRLL